MRLRCRRAGEVALQDLIQQILNGSMAGGVYILFALGITVSLGVLRVVNLAHGATLALSAIAVVKLAGTVDLPFEVLILCGAICGAVIGILLELIAFRPLRKSLSEQDAEMASLVSSMAMLFILLTLGQQWTNAEIVKVPSGIFESQQINIGPYGIRSILLISLVTAIVLGLFSWWVVGKTQIGRAMRAVSKDEEAAAMVGVNSGMVKLVAMAGSGALAGIAGVLLGIGAGAVSFLMGESQLLKGFTVVVLGGIGSIPGAMVGGQMLGVTEGMTVHFFGSRWESAVAFVLLFIFLILRPNGLFGREEVDRA